MQPRKKQEVSSQRVIQALLALAWLLVAGPLAVGAQEEMHFEWVLPRPITHAAPASATAHDGSKIMISGSGSFIVPREPQMDFGRGGGSASAVTGGGQWETRDNAGNVTGSGNFHVIELVRFEKAPGAVANPAIRAGLAHLRIAYDDNTRGVLLVSCRLPGSPPSMREGITASKGFVDYSNTIEAPSFFRVP